MQHHILISVTSKSYATLFGYYTIPFRLHIKEASFELPYGLFSFRNANVNLNHTWNLKTDSELQQ